MMYGRALEQAKKDLNLNKIPEQKRQWMAKYYGKLGGQLRHQPFGQYRRHGHEFGGLRLWFKYKNFKIKIEERCWADLGWRPLVSFTRHRYKRALSLISRL
jgi:hypothetical protein